MVRVLNSIKVKVEFILSLNLFIVYRNWSSDNFGFFLPNYQTDELVPYLTSLFDLDRYAQGKTVYLFEYNH